MHFSSNEKNRKANVTNYRWDEDIDILLYFILLYKYKYVYG